MQNTAGREHRQRVGGTRHLGSTHLTIQQNFIRSLFHWSCGKKPAVSELPRLFSRSPTDGHCSRLTDCLRCFSAKRLLKKEHAGAARRSCTPEVNAGAGAKCLPRIWREDATSASNGVLREKFENGGAGLDSISTMTPPPPMQEAGPAGTCDLQMCVWPFPSNLETQKGGKVFDEGSWSRRVLVELCRSLQRYSHTPSSWMMETAKSSLYR